MRRDGLDQGQLVGGEHRRQLGKPPHFTAPLRVVPLPPRQRLQVLGLPGSGTRAEGGEEEDADVDDESSDPNDTSDDDEENKKNK